MVMYRKIHRGEFQWPKWTPPNMKRLITRLLDTNPETRIRVDDIIDDPWFRNGYRAAKGCFYEKEFDWKDDKGDGDGDADGLDGAKDQGKCMNAFDIISMLLGIDLTRLMSDKSGGGGRVSLMVERYVSVEPTESILEKVARTGEEEEGVDVVRWRKGWGVRLEGQNGEFVISVRVHRLTEKLIVIEVRTGELTAVVNHSGGGDSSGGRSHRKCMWKGKLKHMIGALA